MLPLPSPPASPNEAALARFERSRITNVAGVTLTLPAAAVETLEMVTKNGIVLYPGVGAAEYAIVGDTITLNTAAVPTDVFFIWYHSRGTT